MQTTGRAELGGCKCVSLHGQCILVTDNMCRETLSPDFDKFHFFRSGQIQQSRGSELSLHSALSEDTCTCIEALSF